jgi:GDP-L-fucose synthase
VSSGAIPRDAAVYVAGYQGMVGSAIMRRLEAGGFTNVMNQSSGLMRMFL